MLKQLLTIAIATIAIGAGAATKVTDLDDAKLWSDGLVEWSDFQAHSLKKDAPSYIKVELTTQTTTAVVDGHTRESIKALAVLHRNASWAPTSNPEACTDTRLRYHQLQFDMLEVLRRRLQNDLNTGINDFEAQRKVNDYTQLYTKQIAEMNQATDDGTNETRLQDWEYLVRRQLEDLGVPSVPQLDQGGFMYGIYAGVGGVFPTGELADNFKGAAIFGIGLTAGYNRLRVKADISFGQPSFNNNNIFSSYDAQGRPTQENSHSYATYLGIGMQLGYCVLDLGRFTITPNVGGYWSHYGWDVNNLEWVLDENTQKYVTKNTGSESVKLNNFNWMASIDFDIKIHSYLNNQQFSFTNKREKFSSLIRISPFIAHAKYSKSNPAVSGYHVGFSLYYLGLARALGL